MTLVLTELSHLGIAMAADSAVTVAVRLPGGGRARRTFIGVRKLQQIPKIQAGVSCWGLGEIQGVDADVWLDNFITSNQDRYNSLEEFALLLQDELRPAISPIADPEQLRFGTMGFHVAGYVSHEGESLPAFYHVHNGESEVFPDIDPTIVNANLDCPPQFWRTAPPGHCHLTRNGDFQVYARLMHSLRGFFTDLSRQLSIGGRPFRIPRSNTIDARAEYLRFQIRLVGEMYSLSNHPPVIGGNITTMTVTPQGITSYITI